MKTETRSKVKKLIKEVILSKIDNYSAETEYKPFFQAIFTKEQILTHTIVHSFYTSFGMSIYEQLVKILAEGAGYEAHTQYDLLGEIDDKTEEGEEKTYDTPDISDVTTLYANDRKGFSLLMPKRWYYASFGPVDGTLWKVGFANVGLEEPEEAIITLSIQKAAGGKAYKKIDNLYYVLDGPSDLTAVMKKMADSVEASE